MIQMNTLYYSTSYESQLKNQGFPCLKNEKNAVNSQRVVFTNHRNCSLSELHKRQPIQNIICYSFNLNGRLCNHRTGIFLGHTTSPGGKQFLWFLKKITFLNFSAFFSFLTRANFCSIHICLIRSTIHYLCANVINLDAVDFENVTLKKI